MMIYKLDYGAVAYDLVDAKWLNCFEIGVFQIPTIPSYIILRVEAATKFATEFKRRTGFWQYKVQLFR